MRGEIDEDENETLRYENEDENETLRYETPRYKKRKVPSPSLCGVLFVVE